MCCVLPPVKGASFLVFLTMSRLQRHLIFWVSYILFKIYLNVSENLDIPLEDYGRIALGQALFLVVKVPLVYFTFYVIDRYLAIQWPLGTSIVVLVIAVAISSVGMSTINHLIILPRILKISSDYPVLYLPSLVYHTFTVLFVAGVANAIRLFRRQHASTLREAILQREKTETELKYLKSQVNPHFLFNTLNNIFSLARKGSNQTAEAVLRLSKIMRFVLYESAHQDLLLRDELALIQDYIQLEKLRYTDRLEIRYHEELDNPNQRIAPLLLIPFVENAFKHGVSESRSNSFIHIDVRLTKDVLSASFINSRSHENGDRKDTIGMDNIKRQLKILYPDHTLNVVAQDNTFSVELTIPFKN